MKYWLTLISISFITNLFSNGYDPEEIFYEHELTNLNRKEFILLKEKVKRYNKNSWCTSEKTELLMDLVYLEKPKVCVEIGAFTGSSVLPVATALKLNKQGKIYAIDAWSNKEAIRFLDKNDPNKKWWSQVDMKAVFNQFLQMRRHWNLHDYCSYIKKPSSLAVKDIKKLGQIDVLHIDGDYSRKGSLQDINDYLSLVRKGGYIILSNLYIMINNKQPKLDAFSELFEYCDLVGSINNDNVAVFIKE